jgi:hypothetical protein
MACTGLDFEVFSRVTGATPVESSDENWRFQKARRQIGGIAQKPLRRRLGNFSLFSRYVATATRIMLMTSTFLWMATIAR